MRWTRALVVVVVLGGAAGCGRIVAKLRGSDAGACPAAIHPGYCRGRCRGFAERRASGHARRVWPSAEYAFGKCGVYDVFAERTPDGGGVVEYYDSTGTLVGALDDRVQPCGTFGTIPSCAPALDWHDAGLGDRGSGHPAVPSEDDEP